METDPESARITDQYTGAVGKVFMQVLEGGREEVNRLYGKLLHDVRHTEVTLLDYAEISKAKLELRESTDRDFQPKDMITLEGRGIVPRLGIRVTVPCRIPDSEQTFRIWGSLTKLALKLKVAWAGKKPIPLVVEYDVAEVRKTMRQHVVTSCGAVVKRVFDKPDAKPNLSERIEEIMRISSELNGAD